MALPGSGIQRVIKRFLQYSSPHSIKRFGIRTDQEFDSEGDPLPLPQTDSTVDLHHQPIGDGRLIKDLSEGQRLTDMKKAWTVDLTVQEKDIINIDGFAFTVNAVQEYPGQPGHLEMDIIRTGEQDNIF